jgi:hypothetical protein
LSFFLGTDLTEGFEALGLDQSWVSLWLPPTEYSIAYLPLAFEEESAPLS